MRRLGRILSGIFLFLVIVLSIVFIYYNSTRVSIQFGSLQLPTLPISVWILGAFVLGGIMGLTLGLRFFPNLKSRAEIRRLNKKLSETKQEVSQLRTMSLKDL